MLPLHVLKEIFLFSNFEVRCLLFISNKKTHLAINSFLSKFVDDKTLCIRSNERQFIKMLFGLNENFFDKNFFDFDEKKSSYYCVKKYIQKSKEIKIKDEEKLQFTLYIDHEFFWLLKKNIKLFYIINREDGIRFIKAVHYMDDISIIHLVNIILIELIHEPVIIMGKKIKKTHVRGENFANFILSEFVNFPKSEETLFTYFLDWTKIARIMPIPKSIVRALQSRFPYCKSSQEARENIQWFESDIENIANELSSLLDCSDNDALITYVLKHVPPKITQFTLMFSRTINYR